MREKEILDNLRYVSELHRKLHQQRRSIELRVVLTTLTLYGLATMAALKGEYKPGVIDSIINAVWGSFLVVAFLASAYLLNIHKSNRINIRFSESAEREIMEHVSKGELKTISSSIKTKKILQYLPWIWQTAIILCTAIGSALIINMS
jgi:hypothetical protein